MCSKQNSKVFDLDNDWQIMTKMMCGLGLVSLYQTANVTADLSLNQYNSWVLLLTCQLRVSWPLSSSPRLSLLWFHSCWAFCCQRTGPALFTTHITLHCTLSALAPSVECVLGAVVYVSCPQLVSVLVVFVCFALQRTVARCHIHGGSSPQRQSRCCLSPLLFCSVHKIKAGTTKTGRGLARFVVSWNEKGPEQVKLWIHSLSITHTQTHTQIEDHIATLTSPNIPEAEPWEMPTHASEFVCVLCAKTSVIFPQL